MSDKIYIWQSEESDSCDECKSLNGKVFTNKDDAPSPPLHPNCKCKLVEVEKKEPPLCLTGCAIPFEVKGKWQEEVTGSASIDSRGNIDHSAIRRFKKKYYE